MSLYVNSEYYVQKRRIVWGMIAASVVLIILSIAALILPGMAKAAQLSPDDFVTTWQTDIDTPGDSTIMIYTDYKDSNFNIDWNNDGIFDEMNVTDSYLFHDFGEPGVYTIRMSGSVPNIQQCTCGNPTRTAEARKLIDINQWGSTSWTDMSSSFEGATNLNMSATDIPNLTRVKSMRSMFSGASSFTGDVSDWDTSQVTDMSAMFFGASSFAGDVSNWDTSQVTDMSAMFGNAHAFNGDISGWDTGQVVDMAHMFRAALKFNADISGWDTGRVVYMYSMFDSALLFNRDLSGWDTSQVTDMSYMFNDARVFNRDLSSWDTSQVTDMRGMFLYAKSFNHSLGVWNVASVVRGFQSMLDGSGLSSESYDATLRGWSKQALHPGMVLSAYDLTYCSAASERQYIIDTFNWTITEDRECRSPGFITLDFYGSEQGIDLGSDGMRAGDDLGLLRSSSGMPDNESVTFSISCQNTATGDSLFKIANDHLIAVRDVSYDADPHATNEYQVCIRATNSGGRSSEEVFTLTIAKPRRVTGVSFVDDQSKKILVVTGEGMVRGEEYMGALNRSLVTLNGQPLPFCSDGLGMSAEVALPALGMTDKSLISDNPACYYLADMAAGRILISLTEALIWVPDTFDATAKGTVSINGSDTFTFNAVPDGEDGGAVTTPEVRVDGSRALDQHPTIPSRPVFSGVATPGSTVVVTVYSDPISCTTTADSSGRWTCTLPTDLPAGEHTVRVQVTTLEGEVSDLGPYAVTVDGVSAGVVTPGSPKAPGVPDTSALQQKVEAYRRMTAVKSSLWVAGSVVSIVAAATVVILYRRRNVVAFDR